VVESRSSKLVALLAWLLVVAASGWQLFHSPVIGISNNGDHSKVSGDYKLAPVVVWQAEVQPVDDWGFEAGLVVGVVAGLLLAPVLAWRRGGFWTIFEFGRCA